MRNKKCVSTFLALQPSLIFAIRPETTRVEHLSPLGLAPGLTTNVRLGWEGSPVSNALAYLDSSLMKEKVS